MPHDHHTAFVALSLIVAVFGSWTALDLFRRVRSHIGRTRAVWLGAAAVAMGVGIWSMHFVAMLGFDPGAPVTYDIGLTLASLALAIAATWGAFLAAARERSGGALLTLAGAAMGAGICGMHYLGMAALRTSVGIGYDPALVAVSLAVAVVAATAALFAAQQDRSRAWRATAALVLGFAIAGMHYTAMAALELSPTSVPASHTGAPPYFLAVGVAGGAMTLLFLALMASLYDQRLNVLAALDAGEVGYWELDVARMKLHLSPRARMLLGVAAGVAFGLEDLLALAPGDGPPPRGDLDEAIAGYRPFEIEVRTPLRHGETRWIHLRGRMAGDGARARRMVGVAFDITERREAFGAVAESERRQRVLIDELNHRVKNTLAAVQSISRQSAKRAGSLDDFCDLFESRLIALSQTHNALNRSSWAFAGLSELLGQQLDPYPPEQLRLEGPAVDLSPREALALGMVFHELAANAAKYGALSTPRGVVAVSWEAVHSDAGSRLTLDWIEAGGPPVAEPVRRGFGARMINGAIAGELGGSAELAFPMQGFRARLSLTLDHGRTAAPPPPLSLAAAMNRA